MLQNQAVNRSGEIGADLQWTINRRRPVIGDVRRHISNVPCIHAKVNAMDYDAAVEQLTFHCG